MLRLMDSNMSTEVFGAGDAILKAGEAGKHVVKLADGSEYARAGKVNFTDVRVNPETGTIVYGSKEVGDEAWPKPQGGLATRLMLTADGPVPLKAGEYELTTVVSAGDGAEVRWISAHTAASCRRPSTRPPSCCVRGRAR